MRRSRRSVHGEICGATGSLSWDCLTPQPDKRAEGVRAARRPPRKVTAKAVEGRELQTAEVDLADMADSIQREHALPRARVPPATRFCSWKPRRPNWTTKRSRIVGANAKERRDGAARRVLHENELIGNNLKTSPIERFHATAVAVSYPKL